MLISLFGFEISLPGLVLGVIIGMTYGILAVGLVLIHRSSQIINFAHGEIGAFGAAVLAIAVIRWHFPYWAAFPLGIASSAGLGVVVETGVVRRLRTAPKLMSVVATLGVAQFVFLVSFAMSGIEVRSGGTFPQPIGFPAFQIGVLRITPAYSAMLFLTPLIVGALTWFLRRSRYGVAIRGSAANPQMARLVGLSASRMSSLAWGIAGAVSAFTAILVSPTLGLISGETLGPSLLLRALAAAVLGRLASLPVAFIAGIGIGVLEVAVSLNTASGGLVEVVLAAVILVALLFQTRRGGREEEKGSWTAVQPWRPLHESLLRVRSIRNLGWIASGLAVIGAILLVWLGTNRIAIIFVSIMAFALIGVSLAIITGLAGQLSLGQFALAGIGATVSALISRTQGNFVVGFILGGLVAAALSVLIGIPALRIRGLMLAVTTLAFALAAQAWLLQQTWMLGSGMNPGRPIVGTFALDTGKRYYVFTLVVLLLMFWLYRNVRRGSFGRSLVGLRDNEDGARAFTVPATRRKLQAFALAGFVAGLGGAVYGHGLASISFQTFTARQSIDVVAMTVIGGIGILAGPLLGALYIIGVPSFVPLDSAGLAATAFGWLLLILYFPGGLAQLVRPLRDRLVTYLARGVKVEDPAGSVVPAARLAGRTPARAQSSSGVLLETIGLRKYFGGVRAVDDVSLAVRHQETLGLIGPNGAGKTTLFEVISGFTPADTGHVIFGGRDVTRLSPEARGRLGLIRSFQDASLFETLTVVETVAVALEREFPTRFFPSVLGWRSGEARKLARARELVSLMGLDAWRDVPVCELSTGTRRITEITCLLALKPTLLLLDEPSSGVAQRETEALGELLKGVKSELDTTIVIIEHDMPLVMGISDRIVAMEAGRIIAEGTPAEVRNDPLVIQSYLGGDAAAIERSGRLVGS